jgi:hypothetical protein
MRSPLRILVLTIAVLFAVAAAPALAEQPATWRAIAVEKVPRQVLTGQKRLFAHDKITKAEKSGSGSAVRYRLTIDHKGEPTVLVLDAQGKTIR